MPRLHCIISGRVQGVGYRYFAEHAARSLGLTGWVRNLRGGDVETEVEGSRENLQKYLLQLHRGPAFARVQDVREVWSDEDGRYEDFKVRFTF